MVGRETSHPLFPWCIILRPIGENVPAQVEGQQKDPDLFINQLVSIPEGTIVYEMLACPTPEAAANPDQLERLGVIRTASEVVRSGSSCPLFFKHQKKEEDYSLRPQWQESITDFQRNAGWELFEGHASNRSCPFAHDSHMGSNSTAEFNES